MTPVLLLVGDEYGQGCGAGDFVGTLQRALQKRGVDADTVVISHFRASKALALARELERRKPDIVHFNFPSMSLGKSPAVSLLPLVYRPARWLITVHEFQVLNPLRRLSLRSLPLTFDHYVFSNPRERDLMSKGTPRIARHSSVIPMPSNIRIVHAPDKNDPARLQRLVYFGQIVPHKGLETFLQAAEEARKSATPLQPVIVGARPAWARAFADAILARARDVGCEIVTDAAEDEVSKELASCAFAYLPYPDGASLKRGSLAAALAHGCMIATTWSAVTPDAVREATIEAQTPAMAIAAFAALRADAAKRASLEAAIARFAADHSEDAIAVSYAALYQRLSLRKLELGQKLCNSSPHAG